MGTARTPDPSPTSVAARVAGFAVRRRRLVLGLSALFVVVAAAIGTGAFGKLQDGGFEDPDAESTRASDVLDERFDDGGAPTLVLLARSSTGDVDDADATADGAALTDALAAVPGVTDVESYWSLGGAPPLRSSDGDEALVLGRITGDDEDEDGIVADVHDRLAGRQGVLDVAVGGPDAVGAEITSSVKSSLGRAELIAIPLTLLLLLFVFRSVRAASLPLLIGMTAIMGTLLVLFVLGSITDVSVYSINLTTALGLGLAIDYSLFIVSRYREELGHGLSVTDAIVRSVDTAGRTVTISALTVAVSLSALLIFPLYFLRSFAYAGIAVVLLAMVAALVTLPALLAAIGPRIDSRRARRRAEPESEAAAAPAAATEAAHGFWHRVATTVMRRPLPIAVAVTVVLLLLGVPFLRLSVGLPDERVLPESSEARQVSERIQAGFAGDTAASFPVVVEADGGGAVDQAALAAYAADISAIDGVARVEGPGGIYQDGAAVEAAPADGGGPPPDPARYVRDGTAWLDVVPAVEVQSAAGERLVEDIRALDPGVDTLVGGSAAQLVDTKDALLGLLPWALAIVAVTTLVLLFLMTGSVLIPVKALVLNLLSLTATFGAMVWVFQDGHLSGPLGFTATGRIDTSMPILMFCIAFGLSMDYEVFLLSRIKEEHDATGDNTASVALGLERTGRIVSAAAILLAITFLAFGTADVSFLKLFGVGLALAVLMDATVVRGLLVPAFMRLAGPANWWAPPALRRLHRRIGIAEHPAPPAPRKSAEPEPV
jgi:putative drug exporter of the RND superfamily